VAETASDETALQPACQIFAVVFSRGQFAVVKLSQALQAMRIGNVGMLLNPSPCQSFPTHDMME
jgi:hypothetical protein